MKELPKELEKLVELLPPLKKGEAPPVSFTALCDAIALKELELIIVTESPESSTIVASVGIYAALYILIAKRIEINDEYGAAFSTAQQEIREYLSQIRGDADPLEELEGLKESLNNTSDGRFPIVRLPII